MDTNGGGTPGPVEEYREYMHMATIERPSSNEVSLYHRKKERQDLPGGQESRNRKEESSDRLVYVRIGGTRLEKKLHVRVMTGGGGSGPP